MVNIMIMMNINGNGNDKFIIVILNMIIMNTVMVSRSIMKTMKKKYEEYDERDNEYEW
jgi:hypothetical protein